MFLSKGNVQSPAIVENQPAADFSEKKSGQMSLGLGLSLLSGIISAFGGSTARLNTAFSKIKSIRFKYEAVVEDSIAFAQLDRFLSDADVDPLSKCVGELLDADQVYITTAVLKTNKFSIYPEASGENTIEAAIPKISNLVGAEVKVTANSVDNSMITFEGKAPLVFGFQAWQLFYNKGKYGTAKPADKALTLGPSKSDAKILTQGPFVRIGG